MQHGEIIPSEITIAGKTFPLRITNEEAGWVQEMEEEINHKIEHFREEYAHLDKADSIIMTLITYAFESKKVNTIPESKPSIEVEPVLDDILEWLSHS